MTIFLLILLGLLFFFIAYATAPAMADPSQLGPVDVGKPIQAAAVTKTATFSGAGLDLGSGFAPGGGGQPFQAAVPISALDFTTGNETYSYQMEHSSDDSTYVACGAAVLAVSADVGSSILLHGTVSRRYVRYTVTLAGTTPSITYGPIYVVPRPIR